MPVDRLGVAQIDVEGWHRPARADQHNIASRNKARSGTLRAIGPCTDNGLHRLRTVPRATRPGAGLRPTIEQ